MSLRFLLDTNVVSEPLRPAPNRRLLLAQGRTPAFIDSQIAAIAIVDDLVLVTANRSHFVGFADLEIDDWLR